MKTFGLFRRHFPWLAALGLSFTGAFLSSASPEDQPLIKSIYLEATNVVVTVQVPDGIKRVRPVASEIGFVTRWVNREIASP